MKLECLLLVFKNAEKSDLFFDGEGRTRRVRNIGCNRTASTGRLFLLVINDAPG